MFPHIQLYGFKLLLVTGVVIYRNMYIFAISILYNHEFSPGSQTNLLAIQIFFFFHCINNGIYILIGLLHQFVCRTRLTSSDMCILQCLVGVGVIELGKAEDCSE
jgi:hypothetical protein